MNRLAGMFVAGALLVGGGVGAAMADPGPHHGNNKKGLCTAYFNGSPEGREHKRTAKPFEALELAAGVDADDDTVEERDAKVREFCGDLIGGRAGRAE